MNRDKLVRECKALFPRLRPVVFRWIEAEFAKGEEYSGMFMPSSMSSTSRLSDTIVINLHYCKIEDTGCKELDRLATEALVHGVVLHELIHAEQWTMGHSPSHGAYFTHRREELQTKTGIIILP